MRYRPSVRAIVDSRGMVVCDIIDIIEGRVIAKAEGITEEECERNLQTLLTALNSDNRGMEPSGLITNR